MDREESMEIEDGRNSAAAEARLDIEDHERVVVTPLPTNEIIAGSQSYFSSSI